MALSSACNAQPMVNFPGKDLQADKHPRKNKVVVVVGTTGSGKSRLSIDLATRFNGEVINSDKIQVYKGMDVITNKVTYKERRGIPHHLLGIVDNPDEDYTTEDFVRHATLAADGITWNGRLPIIAGGSNSFVKALVMDDAKFKSRYECCFLWLDVSMVVLHSYVSKRVDEMVERGLVAEAKGFFEPSGDYSRGIRRSIGVPEMDEFFRRESSVSRETRAKLLEASIDQIKKNTCELTCRQRQKILRLREQLGRGMMHRIDATEVYEKHGRDAMKIWERLVLGSSIRILTDFLGEKHDDEKRGRIRDLERGLPCTNS